MTFADLSERAAIHGLVLRGAFRTDPAEVLAADEAGTPARTVVLLGFTGRQGWRSFAAAPEARDGRPDPLDRWSRRVIGALATEAGARPLYPFDGPPWLPFQRWARRADAVFPSPLGLLVHATFGPWHSYRGALAFAEALELPAPSPEASPCTACPDRPCLTTCPIGAFRPEGYDAGACRAHLRTSAGATCMAGGCQARRACPVGREHAYDAEQAGFLMRAFESRLA